MKLLYRIKNIDNLAAKYNFNTISNIIDSFANNLYGGRKEEEEEEEKVDFSEKSDLTRGIGKNHLKIPLVIQKKLRN